MGWRGARSVIPKGANASTMAPFSPPASCRARRPTGSDRWRPGPAGCTVRHTEAVGEYLREGSLVALFYRCVPVISDTVRSVSRAGGDILVWRAVDALDVQAKPEPRNKPRTSVFLVAPGTLANTSDRPVAPDGCTLTSGKKGSPRPFYEIERSTRVLCSALQFGFPEGMVWLPARHGK
jgi:hypothetical protein